MTHRSQARQGQGLKNTFFCEVETAVGDSVCCRNGTGVYRGFTEMSRKPGSSTSYSDGIPLISSEICIFLKLLDPG